MLQYRELVKRNMRLFLRDKGAVFFSLLSMLIVLALMLFFLGDMNVDNLKEALAEIPERNADTDADNAFLFVVLWTCAGIVSINAVTVTLAVYSTMIKDRTEGRLASIYTLPISKLSVSASYVTAAWLCSVIICAITLAISEIYCIIIGGEIFSVITHLRLLGMIAVNSFAYAALMYLAATLIKTQGAWSGIGTVVGTLVGFLGGIYIPVGALADGMVNVMKFIPVLYGTKMFRSVMTEDICARIFDGVPDAFRSEYLEIMGVELDFFGNGVNNAVCVILLALCGIIFLSLGVFAAKRNGTR